MTLTETLTGALLSPILARDPARPLITYYDDATGERIELSGTTMVNWAAKTANLLRDECDVEPGAELCVLLPAHWQTAAVLLGAWWCGAHVVADPSGAQVVLAEESALPDVTGTDVTGTSGAGAADTSALVVGLSLDAFGRGLSDPPPGVIDYATEVRLHGDDFVPDTPVPANAPALAGAPAASVLTAARERAAALGLSDGDRALSTLDWTVPDGVLDGLLSVLVVGGSLVQCRHSDDSALARRIAAERTTARLG